MYTCSLLIFNRGQGAGARGPKGEVGERGEKGNAVETFHRITFPRGRLRFTS